jgi:hypothetical protein
MHIACVTSSYYVPCASWKKREAGGIPLGAAPVPTVSTTTAVANSAAATQMVLPVVAHPLDGGSSQHRALSTALFEKSAADQGVEEELL